MKEQHVEEVTRPKEMVPKFGNGTDDSFTPVSWATHLLLLSLSSGVQGLPRLL